MSDREIFAPYPLSKGEWPPNYVDVFAWRQMMLVKIANDPTLLYGAKAFYAEHPVEFICHWIDTFDPRNVLLDLPMRLPFVLFERQAELVLFLRECLKDEENGLVDKSRDTGATWICSAFSIHLWLFFSGSAVGWGSRKQDFVDRIGVMDSIFEKMRSIVRGLPPFFLPLGFVPETHMTFMRFINPENDSTIVGEAGDNIGRGGRTSIYFKDESAHYEHPESIEAALGDNTRVQIDISTHNGIGTIFDRKRQAGIEWEPGLIKPKKGTTRVFVMDWSDHPAKTREWYEVREQKAKDEGLLHLFRQEVDRNPAASVQGIICPQEWVLAAVDAHKALGIALDDGAWTAALDVADEGLDANALTLRKGVQLMSAEDWGEGDTGVTTRRAVDAVRDKGTISIFYDCVGVGAGVKAESNRLAREGSLPKGITFLPWDAGAGVLYPDKRIIPGDPNTPFVKDFFSNLKAQGWWELRRRFEKTYRAIHEGIKYPSHELISIDSRIPKLRQLTRELSQPTVDYDGKMRLKVDKKPEGARSPNLADSVMMNYFPLKVPMIITPNAMKRAMVRTA